jgi:ethanolaminephosphotransferase
MFNVLSNIIIGYYSGLDGKGAIPTWAIFLAAFLYPMYHIFDILDGKHARKTNQSSPLGLLVDHGCDALTTFLFTMCLGSIIRLEGAFMYTVIWLMAAHTFYLCTWEEFQTDRLDFPCFHGVSEGTFMAMITMLFTAIIGQDFWLTPVEIFGNFYSLNNVYVCSVTLISLIFSLISFIKVVQNEKTTSLSKALSNLSIYIYMLLSLVIVIFYSKCNIVENQPKIIIYLYGFCFAKLVVRKRKK